jgi:hypothetical protein
MTDEELKEKILEKRVADHLQASIHENYIKKGGRRHKRTLRKHKRRTHKRNHRRTHRR